MSGRKDAYDLIKDAGYCVPTLNDATGTISLDCASGKYETSADIPRIEAKKVVLDENGKPLLVRTVGDFLVAKQSDVEAAAI